MTVPVCVLQIFALSMADGLDGHHVGNNGFYELCHKEESALTPSFLRLGHFT